MYKMWTDDPSTIIVGSLNRMYFTIWCDDDVSSHLYAADNRNLASAYSLRNQLTYDIGNAAGFFR